MSYVASYDAASIICLALGRGVTRSKRKAMQWLRKAAENGHTQSSSQLAAHMYGDHPYAREVGHVEEEEATARIATSTWDICKMMVVAGYLGRAVQADPMLNPESTALGHSAQILNMTNSCKTLLSISTCATTAGHLARSVGALLGRGAAGATCHLHRLLWVHGGLHLAGAGARRISQGHQVAGRGLHSSTFRLNVSAFCGIGGVFEGCVWGV